MFDRIGTLKMADQLIAHGAQRQRLIATNVANADTPGYRAVDLDSFARSYDDTGDTGLRRTHDRHLAASDWGLGGQRIRHAGGEPNPNGNTVSLEDEVFRIAEARREFDLAVTVTRSSLGLMRTSLGRR